ncbi:hypothetical protein HHK36_027675 [Tetracentron sinense]|uniref:Scarecrow-like protein 8 n=1 Tax=Tetracentron sinense TaxID=13715 RepID=A0A834YEE2_TETSI|nr:hypothetical protein HHK36_027675 [Tetracentron sinense]
MSSGFYAGGADFFSAAGIGGGSATLNDLQIQYRNQLAGFLVNPSSPIGSRQTDMVAKRSLAEFERQGVGIFPRSVKQRSYHHTSPISTLSPVDSSSTISSPEVMGSFSGRYGFPVQQQLRPQTSNPNNNARNLPSNPTLSGLMYSNLVKNRAVVLGSEPESENKMRNRLQELEKQLFDDNDEEEGDAASVNTGSEWNETMQNLITPNQNPVSSSPLSSSSSSSFSPSSYSSSSKQSLIDAATAISDGKIDVAMATLLRLKQVSDAQGDPEQRLTAHMVSALRSRVNPTENPPPVTELFGKEHMFATQMLYEVSPCFNLGYMAANLAILEATRDQPNNVHVVDFDIGHGSQYMTLIHALAKQQSGKPTVIKITTVTDPGNGNEETLRIVENQLRKRAEQVGVGLKFNVVSSRISDLNREKLGCDAGETLVVNFAFRLYKMPDESVSTENPRDELLRFVKGLAPRVVTLVELEMNANTAPLVARVAEACAYYGALFDSLDSSMPRTSVQRVQVEKCLVRKAANSVACEGRDRVERCEVFGKWRARMGMAGFESRPMSQDVAESLRNRLGSANRVNPGFTIKEEAGGICIGWNSRVLTVASVWR